GCSGQGVSSWRTRMQRAAAAPEDSGGVPVSGRVGRVAEEDGRSGCEVGGGGWLSERGHSRVLAERQGRVLFPGNEHAPPGGTRGYGNGVRRGSGEGADSDCRGRGVAV